MSCPYNCELALVASLEEWPLDTSHFQPIALCNCCVCSCDSYTHDQVTLVICWGAYTYTYTYIHSCRSVWWCHLARGQRQSSITCHRQVSPSFALRHTVHWCACPAGTTRRTTILCRHRWSSWGCHCSQWCYGKNYKNKHQQWDEH